jgi:hypothetical protein
MWMGRINTKCNGTKAEKLTTSPCLLNINLKPICGQNEIAKLICLHSDSLFRNWLSGGVARSAVTSQSPWQLGDKSVGHLAFKLLGLLWNYSFGLCPCPSFISYKATYLLTYLWSWALLEKPTVMLLLKNFPAFYRTRKFITVLTKALHWSLYWAR